MENKKYNGPTGWVESDLNIDGVYYTVREHIDYYGNVTSRTVTKKTFQGILGLFL